MAYTTKQELLVTARSVSILRKNTQQMFVVATLTGCWAHIRILSSDNISMKNAFLSSGVTIRYNIILYYYIHYILIYNTVENGL